MEARTKTIQDWFSMVRQGQIALPRFQRHEAWRASQIEGVLENILRRPSLPIGALLTLEVGSEELFFSRPIVGAPKINGRPNMHLLDGQQRMTALWRSLTDNYGDMTVFVSLEDEEEPQVEIVKRWSHKGVRRPVCADDPSQIFERGLVPASILCPGSEGESMMSEWCESVNLDSRTQIRISNLRSRIASYPIPFLSLPVETSQDTALDVFINMNTSATPLKDFDIVVAQLEAAVGDSLHDKIRELIDSVPAVRFFGKIEDLALSVGALLLDKPPLKRTYLDKSYGEGLAGIWTEVVSGIQRGLAFLRDESIFTERLLPTEVVVYLVSALWARVPEHGHDIEGRARTLIRKALWRASFTDRYLKTSATRAYADYKALSDLILDRNSQSLPELFDENMNHLPAVEEIGRAGWPARKDRLGRAMLAVTLHRKGYDFADGAPAGQDNIEGREYHHLFPIGALKVEREDPLANRAANCALITWRTNRKIAARTPREYIEERARDAQLGEAEVRQRLASHMVPYDALVAGDYEAFINERSALIHQAMLRLCNGETIS